VDPLPGGTNDLPTGTVSNPIMAQPLYVAGITASNLPANIKCSPCDMVVTPTLNGTVFAYIADQTAGASAPGSLLWSRQGTGGPSGTNALWADDCQGAAPGPVPGQTTLPFEGTLSTPVIDASGSTPLVFVTSLCQSSITKPTWFLHEINLTNGQDIAKTNIGSDIRGFNCLSCSGFTDGNQHQRSAVLLAKNGGNALVYILFGTGTYENSISYPYSGFVVAYMESQTSITKAFAYTDEPPPCPSGGGINNGQCTPGNSGTPPCDCYVQNQPALTQNAPNWGGHGDGCWQSDNGAAATTASGVTGSDSVSDNAVHLFFACGNGGFQAFNGTTPSASNNNGETMMDFRLEASQYDMTPFQTFTPYGPPNYINDTPKPPPVWLPSRPRPATATAAEGIAQPVPPSCRP
jgi:hypothetical protein